MDKEKVDQPQMTSTPRKTTPTCRRRSLQFGLTETSSETVSNTNDEGKSSDQQSLKHDQTPNSKALNQPKLKRGI